MLPLATILGQRPRHTLLLIAFAGLLVVLGALRGSWMISRVWNNAGWLQMARVALQGGSTSVATDDFARALVADGTNRRAALGGGMAYAIALDEPNALRLWQQGQVAPDTLYELGRRARDRHQLELALIYFHGADSLLQPTESGQGYFLEGRLCQSYRVDPTLPPAVESHCQDYFAENDGNLLLDGQFEQAIGWGWTGDFFFTNPEKATLALEETEGRPAPSLRLDGLTSGRHGGIYQRIALQPGAKVHFSGYFRAKNAADLAAWLLYVEWNQQGKPQGISFVTADTDMEWTLLEWTVTLPEGSEPWMNFYPALLIGKGTVWSDDLRVEILSE
jgi:hypothetical protein